MDAAGCRDSAPHGQCPAQLPKKVKDMGSDRLMARVWPNGDYVLWSERRALGIDPEVGAKMGSSRVANSHSDSGEVVEAKQRGLQGITRYGSRLVENAAYLLQKKHGAKRLTFLTCTLPLGPEMADKVGTEWPEIVRVFLQRLKRMLEREKLDTSIVSVTEVQQKRFLRDGGLPLHLHMVFQGAHRDYMWCFKPEDFDEAWGSVVARRVDIPPGTSFSSANNVQRVRDNAAGYLGKYMSKGAAVVEQVAEKCPDLVEFLPRTWYNLTREARDLVLRNVAYGADVADVIRAWYLEPGHVDLLIDYSRQVTLRNPAGEPICSFEVGQLTPLGRRRIGLPCHVPGWAAV